MSATGKARSVGERTVETAVAAAVAALVMLGYQEFRPTSAATQNPPAAPAVTREEVARLSEQIRQVDERTRRIEDRLDNLLTRGAR